MDSQITPSTASDPLTATLHDASTDQAERNEFTIARSYTNAIEYEKISEPSNVLGGNSHPFQETWNAALQGPLTPPDNNFLLVPATALPLPRELVERILIMLDTGSILKCKLVNRDLNAIIQSSTLVQYALACNAAGVIDNPQSPLSYAERFKALNNRECAWRKLKPAFETTIEVTDQPSWMYELTAGNYFRSEKNGKDVYCCRLPSSPQDNPQWFRIPGHGPRQNWSGSIVESGMAVYEHDLVVNVISSEVRDQVDFSIDLVLLKFSTGEYHPLARHPLIHVQRSSLAQPYIVVRIVGDNLALIIHWQGQGGSRLFIFDWKSGHRRLQHDAFENAYQLSIPIFVSPELLLVPNLTLSHFEVWHLFLSHPNSNPPVLILSLKIPTVEDNHTIISIECHGELNPFLHLMPYFPPRPFFLSSENSIIIVNLLLMYYDIGYRENAYKLVMHRRALLDMIQKWTSPSLVEQQPTWFTNEFTVRKVSDPDDGSVRFGTQSELVSMTPSSPRSRDSPALATSQNSSTSHISTDSSSSVSSGSTSSTSRYKILQVQWADWGPPISRWFQVKGSKPWWNNQSAGQRYAFLDPNPRDERKCMVCVADFNQQNVRRNLSTTAQLTGSEGKESGGNGKKEEGKKEENEEELEILDHKGVFSEEVYMGLKCVVYRAPGEYEFDGVMMDEERLLGLKLDAENRVENIKVLYFG